MSFTATITIKFANFPASRSVSVVDIMLASGWSQNCFDHIEYLPLGDGDNYDWQHVSLETWADVQTILNRKMLSGEVLGIGLTYKASEQGGTFTITPEGEVSVLLFADRVMLASTMHSAKKGRPLTDFSWYIPKIVVPLVAAGFVTESVQCSDVV